MDAVMDANFPNLTAGEYIGWIEKDEEVGPTDPSELVELDDEIPDGVTLYVGCNYWFVSLEYFFISDYLFTVQVHYFFVVNVLIHEHLCG